MKHSASGLYQISDSGHLTRCEAGRPDSNLKVVLARQADVHGLAKALLGAAAIENRLLTAGERQLVAAIEAEQRALSGEEVAARRSRETERAEGRAALVEGGAVARTPRGKRFGDMFAADPLSADGFDSLEAFLGTLHAGRADDRLHATATESDLGSGGVMVPGAFAAQLLDASLERELVRPRCRVEPMTGDSKKIGGIDTLDHASGVNGVTGGWVAEGGTIPSSDTRFRMIELHAHKLGCLASVSNELLADGVSFEQQLTDALVGAVGWHLDFAALNGTGAGQPSGVLNDPALLVVTKEAAQAAGTFKYENACAMFSRLHPALVGESLWVCSPTVIPQLLTMSIVIGTGGSAVPVLSSDGKGNFTMLTRPVVFSEKVPSLGAKGDVLLVALSQYTIGLRKEVSLDRSIHVGFQTDTTMYRALLRADGQGRWSKPFTPRNGDSLSWCVTLEART